VEEVPAEAGSLMAKAHDRYISEADMSRIEAAVAKAESTTSGEIAVRITLSAHHWLSDRFAVSSLLAFVAIVMSLYVTRDTAWGTTYDYFTSIIAGTIAFAVGLLVVSPLLHLPAQNRSALRKKVLDTFHQFNPTEGQTGVLIFVSLEEKEAAIVADKAIADKLPKDYWDKPQAMIAEAILENRFADGIIAAVEDVGAQLAPHFPRADDDVNELPDRPEVF
jgi:putative membrane protein